MITLEMGDTWMARKVPDQMTNKMVGAWDAIIRGAMPYWKLDGISMERTDYPYMATGYTVGSLREGILHSSSSIKAVVAKFKFSFFKCKEDGTPTNDKNERSSNITLASCRVVRDIDFTQMYGDYPWLENSVMTFGLAIITLQEKLDAKEMDIDQVKVFLKTLRGLTSDVGWEWLMNSLLLTITPRTRLSTDIADYMLDELGDAGDAAYLVFGWHASFFGKTKNPNFLDNLTFGLEARYANALRKLNVSSVRVEYGTEFNYATWLAGMQRVPTKNETVGFDSDNPIIAMFNCLTLYERTNKNSTIFAPMFLTALGSMFTQSVKERKTEQPGYLATSYLANQHSLLGAFDIEDRTTNQGRSELADMVYREIVDVDKKNQRSILNGKQGTNLREVVAMKLASINHARLAETDRIGLVVNGEALINLSKYGRRNGRYSEWIDMARFIDALIYALTVGVSAHDDTGVSGISDYALRYEFSRIAGQPYDEQKYRAFNAWFNRGKSSLVKFASVFKS